MVSLIRMMRQVAIQLHEEAWILVWYQQECLPRIPLSYSKWAKLPPEERGEKHAAEKRPGNSQS